MISRKKIGKNFFYYHNGTEIKSKKIIDRINKLKIPPAYNNVEISDNANSRLQASGIDSKNRKQYIYNSNFKKEQIEIKFCELINFGKKIKKIRSDINKHISKSVINRDVLIYSVLYLVDQCNFRIGSKKYKKLYKTYGVTTLNKSHITFYKNHIKIKFVGKKNIVNESIVKNKKIINILNQLCNTYSRKEFIFSYILDGKEVSITDKSINNFLQKRYSDGISVKMFRTWNANYILLKELIYTKPDDIKNTNKFILNTIKKVSSKLHNSPNVSKKNYINNELINLYTTNKTIFYNILNQYTKNKKEFPTVDKILNHYLSYLCSLTEYKLRNT